MPLRYRGFAAPGFEGVAAAFEANFVERGEVGAAFAAVVDGRTVVDLWGGLADQEAGRPWRHGTLQVVFSGTKGLVAVCLAMLVDRGQLDPDTPVCRYWPEFAAAGKEHVLVNQIASHRARLPGIRTKLVREDILDDERMAALLAAQPQEGDQRAADVYHALTYGWLCGELIRRVDGRSVGRFFADEVAEPLDLEIWMGLPAGLEERVSTLRYADDWGNNLFDDERLSADELLGCVWNNPPLFPPDHVPWNTRAFHAAEIPGAGGIGTARSIARLYGCLARGGEQDGVRLVSQSTLERAQTCLARRRDPLFDEPAAFGLGFELQTERQALGPADDAFGHCGAGGSAHGAWPTERVGFSYCMNEMRDDQQADRRPHALLKALRAAVRDRPETVS